MTSATEAVFGEPGLNPGPVVPETTDMAEKVPAEAGRVSTLGRTLQQRRRHARVHVNGKVRLVADTSDGLVTLAGHVVDLSISGCAIRVHAPLETDREARLELTLDGESVWVPGHVVWTRTADRAWMVGVRFDRLVPDKQSMIMRIVAERQRNSGYLD